MKKRPEVMLLLGEAIRAVRNIVVDEALQKTNPSYYEGVSVEERVLKLEKATAEIASFTILLEQYFEQRLENHGSEGTTS